MRHYRGDPCCGFMARPRRLRRWGFTLVEAAVCFLIVGLMLVAALNTVGASRRTQYVTSSRSRGELLAEGLMAEILHQAYEEPPPDPPVFGVDAGEGAASRANWDDVDDYHGWSASPPQNKDGTVMADLAGWTRSVEVVWVNPDDLKQASAVPTGVKRITVTVRCDSLVLAARVAVRTEAWPDGTDRLKVLLVVVDQASPNAQESATKTLMESWGYTVNLIQAAAPQAEFDGAPAGNHVAYIPRTIDAAVLGTKLRNASIGVVNEKPQQIGTLGLADANDVTVRADIQIIDNTHYITSLFGAGTLAIYSASADEYVLLGSLAPGLADLAHAETSGTFAAPAVAAVETGGQLYDGGTAAGRRVQLPWGGTLFDLSSLTEDGKTLMRRSIEWAANREQTP